MAKKNTTPEEDWFDDEVAEDKPKKKKGGKKKKKKVGKIVAWIVAFVVILAILLFIRFKYTAPAEEAAPEEEVAPPDEIEQVYVPEPDKESGEYEEAEYYDETKVAPGPDVVPKEDLPKVVEVIDTTIEPELFSNIRCDYDYDSKLLYISLRIYNILGEDIRISPRGVMKGYNTYFLIRGVVDTDPGCGTELVEPGEYTECKRIGFDLLRYANLPGINRISVQVPGKTEALLVECPEFPESHFEEEE
ncbi:hypothetical protein KY359_02280 [Candidatus Woesearchaeota archaeon]|nr:hypothetical protein [Candidatus Woesearchaeota archaeon]